jgi:hypothetical protein
MSGRDEGGGSRGRKKWETDTSWKKKSKNGGSTDQGYNYHGERKRKRKNGTANHMTSESVNAVTNSIEEALRQQRQHFAAVEATAQLEQDNTTNGWSKDSSSSKKKTTGAALLPGYRYDPVLERYFPLGRQNKAKQDRPSFARSSTQPLVSATDILDMSSDIQSTVRFRGFGPSLHSMFGLQHLAVLRQQRARWVVNSCHIRWTDVFDLRFGDDEEFIDACEDSEYGLALISRNMMLVKWTDGRQSLARLRNGDFVLELVVWVRSNKSRDPSLVVSLSNGNESMLYYLRFQQTAVTSTLSNSRILHSVMTLTPSDNGPAVIDEDTVLRIEWGTCIGRTRILHLVQPHADAPVTISAEHYVMKFHIESLRLETIRQKQFGGHHSDLINGIFTNCSEADAVTLDWCSTLKPSLFSPLTASCGNSALQNTTFSGLRNGNIVIVDDRDFGRAASFSRMNYMVDHMQFLRDGSSLVAQDITGRISLFDIRLGTTELHMLVEGVDTEIMGRRRFVVSDEMNSVVTSVRSSPKGKSADLHWYSLCDRTKHIGSLELKEFLPFRAELKSSACIRFPSFSTSDKNHGYDANRFGVEPWFNFLAVDCLQFENRYHRRNLVSVLVGDQRETDFSL